MNGNSGLGPHQSRQAFSKPRTNTGNTLRFGREHPVSKTISTACRLEYASGFIELGLLNEASDELELIEGEDRLSAEVMAVRANLYMAAKNWDILIDVARELAQLFPRIDRGWIHWAYALRELGRVAEAKAVLLQAEPLHATQRRPTLQYGLL